MIYWLNYTPIITAKKSDPILRVNRVYCYLSSTKKNRCKKIEIRQEDYYGISTFHSICFDYEPLNGNDIDDGHVDFIKRIII